MGNCDHTVDRVHALVSDDDDFFRVAIKSVLIERNGFAEVTETSSFDEAVEELNGLVRFDIGFFDLNMIGMENWLDLSAVRGSFPDMRLVVVSASRRRDDILGALKVGAHGFIHKGLGVSELGRAVDMVCDGQVYVPPFLPEDAIGAMSEPCDIDTSNKSQLVNDAWPDIGSFGVATLPLKFSTRQREIIDLLVAGQSNKGMARALNLSEGTIKFHMSAVLRLLGATSRVEAATRAMKLLSI